MIQAFLDAFLGQELGGRVNQTRLAEEDEVVVSTVCKIQVVCCVCMYILWFFARGLYIMYFSVCRVYINTIVRELTVLKSSLPTSPPQKKNNNNKKKKQLKENPPQLVMSLVFDWVRSWPWMGPGTPLLLARPV